MTPTRTERYLRLPPFAKTLGRRLADQETWSQWCGTSPDGTAVTVWIAAGGGAAWSWAKSEIGRRLLLVAPLDSDPVEFSWSLIVPHPPAVVVIFETVPSGFIDRLAVAMLRDGIDRILVMLPRGLVRYRRSHE